jgi:hypothetical protein
MLRQEKKSADKIVFIRFGRFVRRNKGVMDGARSQIPGVNKKDTTVCGGVNKEATTMR